MSSLLFLRCLPLGSQLIRIGLIYREEVLIASDHIRRPEVSLWAIAAGPCETYKTSSYARGISCVSSSASLSPRLSVLRARSASRFSLRVPMRVRPISSTYSTCSSESWFRLADRHQFAGRQLTSSSRGKSADSSTSSSSSCQRSNWSELIAELCAGSNKIRFTHIQDAFLELFCG